MEKRFKILLVGDAQTGKSAYLKKLVTGVYERDYSPTIGLAVRELQFETSAGQIVLDVWDTAGQPKLAGLGDAYYINADA